MTIQTHAQAKVNTTVLQRNGTRVPAVLTTKQWLMTHLKSLRWVDVSVLIPRISRSGLRRALTELRQAGYGIETRYSESDGSITSVRLTHFAGIGGPFRRTA